MMISLSMGVTLVSILYIIGRNSPEGERVAESFFFFFFFFLGGGGGGGALGYGLANNCGTTLGAVAP